MLFWVKMKRTAETIWVVVDQRYILRGEGGGEVRPGSAARLLTGIVPQGDIGAIVSKQSWVGDVVAAVLAIRDAVVAT